MKSTQVYPAYVYHTSGGGDGTSLLQREVIIYCMQGYYSLYGEVLFSSHFGDFRLFTAIFSLKRPSHD